jgi:tetratricopeptide (TPR) repeat protein
MASVVTAALVLVVAGLAGSIGWVARDQAARQAVLEQEVSRALEDAKTWYERGRWSEAMEAVKRAEGLLAGGPESVRLQERVHQWQTDLTMVIHLDDIRLERTGVRLGEDHFDSEGADPRYRKAFQQYGVDLEALDSAEAAERIRAAAIKDQLVAAVDDWADVKKACKFAGWEHLLAVARGADSDPLRDRLRQCLLHENRPVLMELARSKEVSASQPVNAVLLADALAQEGEELLAIEVLRTAQLRHPNDFWINHQLGYSYRWLRPPQWGDALTFYMAAVVIRPDSAGAQLNLGDALREQGKLADAEGAYREAIRLKPDYVYAHNNLGIVLHDQGRLPEAEAAYREVIGIDPNYALAHNNLGNVLWAQGKPREAEAACREAIRLKPKYADAYYNLGVALTKQGQPAEGEAAFREALRIKPDHYQASYGLCAALVEQGKLQEAETAGREAIRLKPDSAEAHTHLGDALRKQDKLPQAVAEYRQALQFKPDSPEAHNGLGGTLFDQGKFREAESSFREAISLKPKVALYHSNLGYALCGLRKFVEADAEYREAIRLQPEDANAHNQLAWFQATCPDGKFRDPQRAMELAKKAVALAPNEGNYWNTLGVAHYRNGECQSALAALEKSMNLSRGGNSGDWFFLAMAHWKLGEKDKARQWYDKAVDWMDTNQPNDEELRRFRAEAEELMKKESGIRNQESEKKRMPD